MVGERTRDGDQVGKMPDVPPDADGVLVGPTDESTLCSSADRGVLARAELQPLLTQHDIERAVREGQRRQVALAPVDRRPCLLRQGAGHVQHAGVEVHAGHLAGRADPRDGRARDDPGAASGVEHTLSGPEPGEVQKHRCPGRKDRGHQMTLVGVRPRAGDLQSSSGGMAKPPLDPGARARSERLRAPWARQGGVCPSGGTGQGKHGEELVEQSTNCSTGR